ncbi:MAG: mechanosensitive ion channel family protein [Ferruginibacter sp.]|nr:mechanosensitive ion channel family protein [Ferruginibacter sp.]
MEILQIQKDSIIYHFTGRAYHWVASYVPRIMIAILLFFIGQLVIRFLNNGFKKLLSASRFDATLRPFLQNLLQIVLQVLMVLGLMQVLGINTTLFAAVIGAFGVAIGLALSGTLQNFASGVLIILLKPFLVGDNIKTQGEEGTVVYIRLFYTVIRTFNNTTLIVPNSKLSNEVIFNLTREKTRRLDISIKFNYMVEFEEVKTALLKTIDSFEQCLKDPPPRIGVEKLESDGYTVSMNAWLGSHNFQDTRLELNELLMRDLKPIIQKV